METTVNTAIRRMENIVIGYKITSIDLVKRLCNVSVTVKNTDAEGNVTDGNTKSFKGVYVSRLLCWNIEAGKGSVEVGKSYESKICSSDFAENPLSMIKYVDKDNSERLLLTFVSERPAVRIELVDPLGNTYVDWKHRYYRKSEFKRYRDFSKNK